MTILEERGNLRARIEVQEAPDEPYDGCGSPLLRFNVRTRGDVWDVQQVETITSYRVDPRILQAARRFGPQEPFERYLRIFHGVREIVSYTSGRDWTYMTFDPAAWRAAIGLREEDLATLKPGSLANMDQYKAWCEGDVQGYIIEKRVTWRREDSAETMDTWEQVDSCWGYYGEPDYVEQVAREALAAYCTDESVTVALTEDELASIGIDPTVIVKGTQHGQDVWVHITVQRPTTEETDHG